MAFKLFFLVAFVAYAQAGGPAAYSIAALSGDHAYVGSSHEHTVKGLYGQNVLSTYSKAVDSAHSSVRVSSSRQSNDILGGYGGYHGYAAPAVVGGYGKAIVSPYAATTYGGYGHAYSKVVSPVVSHGYASHSYATPAYTAPALASHSYAAPAYASHSYATPAYTAPTYAGYGVSKVVSPYAASTAIYGGYAHGLGYAPKVSTVVSHGYTAPALAPAAYAGYGHNLGYGVSKVVSPLSTVVSHGYASPTLGYAPKVVAPVSSVVSHGYSAPAYGYSKVVAPYAAAPAVYGGYGHGLGYGVSKVVSPYHSVAAPVYSGYGVSKIVPPVAAYGAPVAAVKTVASPAFTASVISPGASYSW